MYKSNEELLQFEMQSIVDDLRVAYQQSGKMVSGEWERGLTITSQPNKVSLEGYTYLAGRSAGKQPPVQNILDWVKQKGIQPNEGTQTGLAWAIAKKIAKEGTDRQSSLKIYEEVITPQRIDDIIKKVTQFNIGLFVDTITSELTILENNI